LGEVSRGDKGVGLRWSMSGTKGRVWGYAGELVCWNGGLGLDAWWRGLCAMGSVGEREAEMRSRRNLTAALFKCNKLSSSYSSIHNIISWSHNDLSAIGKSTVGSKWNLIGSLQYPICNRSLEYVFSCVNKTSLMLYICPVNRRKTIPIKLLSPMPTPL
jgi:hypothetical protein